MVTAKVAYVAPLQRRDDVFFSVNRSSVEFDTHDTLSLVQIDHSTTSDQVLSFRFSARLTLTHTSRPQRLNVEQTLETPRRLSRLFEENSRDHLPLKLCPQKLYSIRYFFFVNIDQQPRLHTKDHYLIPIFLTSVNL